MATADIAFGKSFTQLSGHIASIPDNTSDLGSDTQQKVDSQYKPNAIFRATENLANTLPRSHKDWPYLAGEHKKLGRANSHNFRGLSRSGHTHSGPPYLAHLLGPVWGS